MAAVEIFRAGRHQSSAGAIVEIGAADLVAIAAAYDPALHEAPAVVGHPEHDRPAYGWVKGLRAQGETLVAWFDQLDPAFAELVKAGRFKKISAAFYRPDAASNPKPGRWYLRHVGFLGAQPPAVKGLKPAQFGDAGELGVVTFAGPPLDTGNVGELVHAAQTWQATQRRVGMEVDIAAAVRAVRGETLHHAEGIAGDAAMLVALARNHEAAMAEAGTRVTFAAAVRAVERG